jgi:hypothetical protein
MEKTEDPETAACKENLNPKSVTDEILEEVSSGTVILSPVWRVFKVNESNFLQDKNDPVLVVGESQKYRG